MESKNTNDEVSIITHLLEIEKEASQIIAAANIKGDKKIAEAKMAADSEFKKLYSEKSDELQKDFENKKQDIFSSHEKIMEEFKTAVENKVQNKDAFYSLLEKTLFE